MCRSLKLIFCFVTALSIQGCIGLGAWTLGSRTESSEHPTIHPTRGALDLHKVTPVAEITSAADLRSAWGEPDRIDRREDGKHEWIYKTPGLRWAGLVLYLVVVPLPAMVPVGPQTVSFVVHEGQVEQATRRDWAFKGGAYCGYFGMMYGRLSCGTGTFEEEQGSAAGS